MNPVRLIRALPQPLKAVTILYFAAFFVTFLAAVLGADIFPVIGVVMLLWGVCLASNINGGAEAMSKELNRQMSGAFDLSKTFLGTTTYMRLVGLFGIGIGVAFFLFFTTVPN